MRDTRPRAYGDQRVTVLGGFGLADGHELDIAEGLQRLVALLAIRRRPLRRRVAAATLWPTSTPDRAHASLRSALARLDTTARSLLTVTRSTLALADHVTIDLWEAETIAHRMARPGPSMASRRPPRATVAMLAADLLPGWHDDWVTGEAESWRQLRLHGLESLADKLRAEGAYGDAAFAAQAAAGADPYRESPRLVLVRIHLTEGNVSEALREYARYRTLLLSRLGLEPSPRLRKLIERYAAPDQLAAALRHPSAVSSA